MQGDLIRPHHLIKEMTRLFDLDGNIDTALCAGMYFLNQAMGSERSSVFVYQPWRRELTVLASLDLARGEVSIPRSSGICGWVFEHQQPVIVSDAYADNRFLREVDGMTGFQTRSMICAPLLDNRRRCIGTLQSINKGHGCFSSDDLALLGTIARMIAVAIGTNRRYNEALVASRARKKVIARLVTEIDCLPGSHPVQGV